MKSFKQYIIESEEKIFGHNYDDLLDTIQDEVEYGEAEDILRGKIEELEKIQKENQINLYRVIFVIDKNNIDKNKLGHHYVPDPEDFHEQMIDYLFQNAKKKIKT